MTFFNRNSVRSISAGGSLLLLLFYFNGCISDADQHQWTGLTMGTTYQVKITHHRLAAREVTAVKQKVDSTLVEVNRQMSTYDPQSEISQFNDFRDTIAFPVSREFNTVVKKAIDVSHLSGQAFDITVGPLVDLWGFGKKGPRQSPPAEEEIRALMDRIGIENLQTVDGNALKKKIPALNIDLSAIAKG